MGRSKTKGKKGDARKRHLVIVESPAKARTISNILGPDYEVAASMGHVRDLPPKTFGVAIEEGFKPTYEVISGRRKTISELKKLSEKADTVYLALDMDREGEAIAWHLAESLKLPASRIKRVTFTEITERAIRRAFRNPGEICMSKVEAQQARRILDRIVGYKLSPLLWRKVARGLSAGRVQSIAVKFIVDREKEIAAFVPKEYWKITVTLAPEGRPAERFDVELRKVKGEEVTLSRDDAERIVREIEAFDFVVQSVESKEKVEEPPPPFTTSLLQQQASIRFGFSARKTMRIAQELYEGIVLGDEGSIGLITYMRTDSFRLAREAVDELREFVTGRFGKELLNDSVRIYREKAGVQAAHEAIRPTYVTRTPDDVRPFLSDDQWKLYDLVWRRFVATQMKPARFLVTDLTVRAGDYVFGVRGRVLIFEGHTVVSGYKPRKDEQSLPRVQEGERLERIAVVPSQHFTQPPPRYTEATLVRALEKSGIGRPSTYAPIISTIQERGYVEKIRRGFHATELGMLVTDKLVGYFPKIMDVAFTSLMEEELDKVESGELDWRTPLRQFYQPFAEELKTAEAEMKKEKGLQLEGVENCEKCGKPMVVRWHKRGKLIGCSGFPACRNIRPIKEQTARPAPIQTEEKCGKCGSAMVIRFGKRGRFLSCSSFPNCRNTRSLPKEMLTRRPALATVEADDSAAENEAEESEGADLDV